MTAKRFVKSADTSTPVSASQRAIEQIFGATARPTSTSGRAGPRRPRALRSGCPTFPGAKLTVPVRLEVSMDAVAGALGFTQNQWGRPRESSKWGDRAG